MGKVFASMRHGGARLAGCAGTGDHHYGNNGASSNRSFSILCRSLLSRATALPMVLVVGFYKAKKEIRLRIIMIIIVSNALLIPLSLTPVI